MQGVLRHPGAFGHFTAELQPDHMVTDCPDPEPQFQVVL